MHNNSLHNQGAGNSIRPSGPILFALFLSGMSALIYEVSWIRPITSVLQSTVYVVSLILTAFMLGLALGSLCAKLFIEKVERPLLLYTILEFGIAAYGLLLLSLFSLLPKLLQAVTQIKTPLLYFFVEFSCIFLLLLIPTTRDVGRTGSPTGTLVRAKAASTCCASYFLRKKRRSIRIGDQIS